MAGDEQRLEGDSSGLVGHWKLCGNCRDESGNGNHGENRGADLGAEGPGDRPGSAAGFDGREAYIEIPDDTSLRPGEGDFSVCAWVHTDAVLDDVPGDIASKYDPQRRRGFNLGIQSFAGVTSTQSNYRHLYFGIDDDLGDSEWTDCGRPGNNVWVCALAVCQGELYAGTYESGEKETGHVYRYAGGMEWVDCGSPDQCNAVLSLSVFEGELYAGVGHYRAQGSALEESSNLRSGGKIYRYAGGTEWEDCGKLKVEGTPDPSVYSDWVHSLPGWTVEDVDTVGSLAVYRGELYALSNYHRGMFRYEGGQKWAHCGDPGCRMMALGVFDGELYAAGNEGNKRGGIYCYEGGKRWSSAGQQEGVDQVYSFAAYEGKLYAGTWPEARVFRCDGDGRWSDCGQLGEELEVMGMVVYNGKLYAGTLPLAEVYRYEGGTKWTRTGQLDRTPNAKYRRAWSMAVFQGKLFCGTLPSGHVHALETGKCATYDAELRPGWRHIAAIRDGKRLSLYVDGKQMARSTEFERKYDITNDHSLRIGAGPNDCFNGKIGDLRLYDRALTQAEVTALSSRYGS